MQLEDDTIEEIRQAFQLRKVTKGEVICKQGEDSADLICIATGVAKMYLQMEGMDDTEALKKAPTRKDLEDSTTEQTPSEHGEWLYDMSVGDFLG